MIQVDAALASVFVTILIAIISLAAWLGALHQKVKNNREDIESNRKENRQDHQNIFNKLDEIKREIVNNGRLKAGG